jgi:isocitrate dehydrogenase (NAD+)
MLQYVGEHKISDQIERAVHDVLEKGEVRTGDLGGQADTDTFTNAIIDAL